MATLLERETLQAQLHAQWDQATAGSGRLVCVEGEAGIGKTSLLRAFAGSLAGSARVFWGGCEALRTPRPLGALDDIAGQSGGELQALLSRGADRHRVFVAFMDLLAERPTLVVLEDLHWADEATLDLLRYVGRRVMRTRSLLVASFRSDELVPAHPLRTVLGDLATTGVTRLVPAPLTLAAVHTLGLGHAVDLAELHRVTGGNPFFVTEVLAAGGQGMPCTVQDAVLARAARLSASARAVLDAAAVAGPRVEPWLLQALTAAESTAIDECLATGVLRAEDGAYVFRHELARQAVIAALSPTPVMSLHRLVLQALLARPAADEVAAAARRALHADGAGDAEAAQRFAPVAAHEAAARGAHRQAAAHWALALRHAGTAGQRATYLDAMAEGQRACGDMDDATAARQQASRLWRELGQGERAARSLVELSTLHLLQSRHVEAEQVLREAQQLLLTAPPDAAARHPVQMALAHLHMHKQESQTAIAIAQAALAAAERRDDRALLVDGLNTLGAALMACDRCDEAVVQLEKGLALAEAQHDDLSTAMLFANLGAGCAMALRLAPAELYLQRGVAFCAERDLDAPRLHQVSSLAHVRMLQGRWDDAAAAAQEVISSPRATAIARIRALVTLGRLRARRGDPGVGSALDRAMQLAGGAMPRVAAVQAARAEAAWLEGRDDVAAQEAAVASPFALDRQLRSLAAELLLWCRRGGRAEPVPAWCATHPCALEAAGCWREAADAWRRLGCPYETARALALGDEAAQREALALLAPLEARPLVERIRQRLRAAGVRGLARGPRPATAAHPAGVTASELAVLELLVQGLRNKEIAARLHRSSRTVDHHVEALFAKLGVATRAEAVAAAFRLGVAVRDGEQSRGP